MFSKLHPLFLLACASTLCGGVNDFAVQAGPSAQQCQYVNNIIKILKAEVGGRPWCRHILGLNTVKTITTTSTKMPTIVASSTTTVIVTSPTRTVKKTITHLASPTACTGNYRQPAPTKRGDTPAVTPGASITAAAGTPTMPSALSSYTPSRRVLACKCLKLPRTTSTTTLKTTKTLAAVTSNTTITNTRTLTPSKTISPTITETDKCPLPFPTGCNVDGLDWAVFKNAQGEQLKPDMSNFDPTLYQSKVPERSSRPADKGVGPGVPGIGSDGIIPDLYGTGPYDTGGDYVITQVRGYLYTTVSGEYFVTVDRKNALALYLWLNGEAFGYQASGYEIQYPYFEDPGRLSRTIGGNNNSTGFDIEEVTPSADETRVRHQEEMEISQHRTFRIRPRYDELTAIESGIDSYIPIRLMVVSRGTGVGSYMNINVPSMEDIRDYDWYERYAMTPGAKGRLVYAKSSCRGQRASPFSPWSQGG